MDTLVAAAAAEAAVQATFALLKAGYSSRGNNGTWAFGTSHRGCSNSCTPCSRNSSLASRNEASNYNSR
ncbi:UNVERIFIED_CONTAM: hypothetical protein Sradi_4332800 [Sesamum radiatum]|uniref:Uncharacterized protein n=1 Tax=Sesamum radiatum TaxID=300843 RepID=A0AAW2NMD3_SESRA